MHAGLVTAGLAAVLLLAGTGTALADRDHKHGRHRGWHGPRVVYGGPHLYAPPPRVYYAPPPVYYAPPPVYYAPPAYVAPGISFGINIPLR